ncbi:hypothetical protein FS837_003481 [Tulasnella sp. UAMH 9824]|nr:hypothetical protein FS837_003481 [Tulasnella sp. UAMH 9824]
MSTQPDLSQKRALTDLKRESGLSLNGQDLLMRSASTILHWVQHQTDAPTGHPQERSKTGRFLDRIALTFASGTGPADVGAVIYWDNAYSRLLVDTIPGGHGFDVLKGSMPMDRAKSVPVSENAEAAKLLRDDRYKFCYERGVDAIGVEMHASSMQLLLNDVHNAQNGREQSKIARRNLRPYIYMYCSCKIWQRITARAPRFGHQIAHFFLDKNGEDLLLNNEAFDDKMRIPPASCLLDQDETWLRKLLCGFDQTGTVEYELEEVQPGSSKVVQHLVLNKNVLWILYRFAAKYIQHICQSTSAIRTWVQFPQPGRELSKRNRQRMEEMLDEMHVAFYRLYKLLHHSPSFWRLVDLLGVISLGKLRELREGSGVGAKEVIYESRPSESSSSTNAYASSTEFLLSPTDTVSRPHGDNYQEHDHTRLADDCLADEVGLNMFHTFSDVVRGWLQLVTRWYHAVQDLCDGETVRAAVQHGFSVNATTTPRPQLPRRQRSLISTLLSLQRPKIWSLEQTRDAIKTKATQVMQSMKLQPRVGAIATDAKAVPSTIHDQQLKALQILADFSEEAVREWEEAFEGWVHCEADLACRMYVDDKNGAPSHGKVYPWAPPPETPGFVKEQVIFNLTIEFDRFVRQYLKGKETERSPTTKPPSY